MWMIELIKNAFGALILIGLLLVILFGHCVDAGVSDCKPSISQIAIAVAILYFVIRAFSLRGVRFSEASLIAKIEMTIVGALAAIALVFIIVMNFW